VGPEHAVIAHMDDVHCVVRIMFFQELQDFELHPGLVVVLLFVFDYFQRGFFSPFVVVALDRNTE
jgi:hypothetical protein